MKYPRPLATRQLTDALHRLGAMKLHSLRFQRPTSAVSQGHEELTGLADCGKNIDLENNRIKIIEDRLPEEWTILGL